MILSYLSHKPRCLASWAHLGPRLRGSPQFFFSHLRLLFHFHPHYPPAWDLLLKYLLLCILNKQLSELMLLLFYFSYYSVTEHERTFFIYKRQGFFKSLSRLGWPGHVNPSWWYFNCFSQQTTKGKEEEDEEEVYCFDLI